MSKKRNTLPEYTMYHPDKIEPKRLRVMCKELKYQEYFSFAHYGNEKKALVAAKEAVAKLQERLEAKKALAQSPERILFSGDDLNFVTFSVRNHYGKTFVNVCLRLKDDGRTYTRSERSASVTPAVDIIDAYFDAALKHYGIRKTRGRLEEYARIRMLIVDKILKLQKKLPKPAKR